MKHLQELGNEFDWSVYNKLAGHPLQSYEWGEARKKMGLSVIRVGEFVDDVLVAVYQFTLHKVFGRYCLAYLPRSYMPSHECIDFLKVLSSKYHIIFYKIEPNCDNQIINALPKELIASSYALFPKWTMVLPLDKTEDELLAQMKPKTRYNIKLAQKKGVTVTEMTSEKGFEMFADLYFETTKRQHYHGHDRNYHTIIFDSLKGTIAHILVASYEGIPIAAYELFLFNNILYYPYGGSSLLHRNVMGANLLMWESIKFGKTHGASYYDMWGSAPPDYTEDHPFAGFTRLKQGYGSEFREFIGSYDLVCSTILYKLFMKANTFRQLMLKFR